jgi:hypothetical protein
MMRRLRRFWNLCQWGVIGALGGAVGVYGGFALAEIKDAVDDPLFDAFMLTLPILIGGAILLKRVVAAYHSYHRADAGRDHGAVRRAL